MAPIYCATMSIKSDRWIRRMAHQHRMIEPFADDPARAGVISYGVSSYGYDMRVAPELGKQAARDEDHRSLPCGDGERRHGVAEQRVYQSRAARDVAEQPGVEQRDHDPGHGRADGRPHRVVDDDSHLVARFNGHAHLPKSVLNLPLPLSPR